MSRIPLVPGLAIVAVLTVMLGGFITYLGGAYYAHWDGPIVSTVASTLPIPAARVGKETILLQTYLDDVHSVQIYLDSPEAERQSQRRPMVDSDRSQALERLIREAALRELAEARSISVTDQQVQAVMDELGATSTSTEAFTAFLGENFGWDIPSFQAHVIHPLILTRLLTESYAADHGGDLTALDRYLEERMQKNDVVRYVKFSS